MMDTQEDLVTNVQTAVDAKESKRRSELEEAQRIRLKQEEEDAKYCHKIFGELDTMRGSRARGEMSQEQLDALNSQLLLCITVMEDKKKHLQQRLNEVNDLYVKELREQEEELDLMRKTMEEQDKTLKETYRKKMAEAEKMFQEEFEETLRKDMVEWEQRKITGDELSEMLKERSKKAEEASDAMIKSMMNDLKIEEGQIGILQAQETEKQHQDSKKETSPTIPLLKRGAKNNGRISRMQTVTPSRNAKCSTQDKPSTKASQMSEELKRCIERKERLEKQIKHFAVTNAKKYRDVRRMAEKEVKELAERALAMDSLICQQVLGLAWERPPVELMEPIQPKKHQLSLSGQTSECSQSTDMDGTAVQTEVEEVTLSMETVRNVMELLCDKAGVLINDKLLNLVVPEQKDSPTVVKLRSLLCSFGIEENDVPKLALFLLDHSERQRRSQTEETTSMTHLTSQLQSALKSFLQDHLRSRAESSACQHQSLHLKLWDDPSEDKTYWDRMATIISEDTLQLWDDTENALRQYHCILTDISELNADNDRLQKENTDLRSQLGAIKATRNAGTHPPL
ncbi:dynein regulatory complex protein 1-like [Epinephelus lanceolatus]